MTVIEREEAQKLQEFRRKFPCCTCKLGEICKFKDSVTVVEVPEPFCISISCKYQVEFNQPVNKSYVNTNKQ